ncbi:MAG: lamin tail domain-containing protein [archaeon]|nr:lamin tail domain-containing protein [archaeon]
MSQLIDISTASSGRASPCAGNICINEAMPNPIGSDTATWPNGEWFEVTNVGTTNIDISGWYANNKNGNQIMFDSASIVGYNSSNSATWTIVPGDFMVLARNGSSTSWLTNAAETLELFDSSNSKQDEASWTSASSGASYVEDPADAYADWITAASPTPGSNNSGATAPTYFASDLIISEVMPNPWPSADNETWPGGEWIEISNTGTSTMDLTGWSITDAVGNELRFNETHLVGANSSTSSYEILPGENRIIAINGSSFYGVLNNGGDTLTLHWPNGTDAQQISWSESEPGFSMVDSSVGGHWVYSAYPTPAASNPGRINQMPVQQSDIQFSEVLPNATSDGMVFPDGEWIELHNTGLISIDLMGWSIIDGMGNETFLDPASIVTNQSQGSTMIDADGRRLVQFSSETRLWDNHNHLILVDPSKMNVDMAWYATDYGENVSLTRSTNQYYPWSPTPYPTPGQPEADTTTATGDIVISEIYPDAIGADSQNWPLGEWVELYNRGTSIISLAGWKLTAQGRSLSLHEYNMPFKTNSDIAPGESVLVVLNGTSSFYLKHTSADIISLTNGNGINIHNVSWDNTVEGESLIEPTSMHAGAGILGTNASTGTDWVQSAWPTPGQLNPPWPEYIGSEDLQMTEILPYCNDGSVSPADDWIELQNVGVEAINLSRWRFDTIGEDRVFIREDNIWINGINPEINLLLPQERAVILLDNWIVSGLGDTVSLSTPDGKVIDSATWSIITDCQTLMPGENANDDWVHTMWPTPGEDEPDPSQNANVEDIKFTRFMSDGSAEFTSSNEFVEISNIGNEIATLNGWTLRHTSSSNSVFEAAFTTFSIPANSAIILTGDANSLSDYEDGIIVEMDTVLNRSVYLSDSGAALQLINPNGIIADTIVYGNGPVDVEGWSGISLVEPFTGIDHLIYHRGDGCGQMQDSDTVSDWHQRWGRLGGSTFCSTANFSGQMNVTPLIAPQDGLVDLVQWINQAQTSLHLHVYQLQQMNLFNALLDAQESGVEVTIVLDAGDNYFWSLYDMEMQYGLAAELADAGANVLWFSASNSDPYLFIHSKVAVRDGQSVWMGSGNWKPSSMPLPDSWGNRDWGVIVDHAGFASEVLSQMQYDEDVSRQHIRQATASDMPAGWDLPSQTAYNGTSVVKISGNFSGQLITCPDNCISGLVSIIDSSQSEILLSLQYLDLDWNYGWGANPVTSALRSAAERGVAIRLILNGAYLDEDIQNAVDTFNEQWNGSEGYDVSAIIMSNDGTVSKLHNKGVIIDQQSVLVSSINWGSSALTRNREMGVLIHSQEVAEPYIESWYQDWNRVDNDTDSDLDGLPDYWEVQYSLNRSQRFIVSQNLNEGLVDADGDGLQNYVELLFGGNPMSVDTDGDCIEDDVEVAWAQSTAMDSGIEDVSPFDAINLADADGDGVNESESMGCDLGGILVDEPTDNETNNQNATSDDADGDGIPDAEDLCPNTPTGISRDLTGCSAEQRALLATPSTQEGENLAANLMMYLMISAGLLLVGAFLILNRINKNAEERKDLDTLNSFDDAEFSEPIQTSDWAMPVLDGSNPQPVIPAITQTDLQRFPGWDETTIRSYLDQGWTIEQLDEYYQQQVSQHNNQS